MSISVLKLRDHFNAADRKHYIVDADDDFANLPGLEACSVGSTAYSIDSGKSKIINHAGEWKDYKSSGSGGGGGGDDLTDVSAEGM